MSFYPFDPERVTVSHFTQDFVAQLADMPWRSRCRKEFAARLAAVQLYRDGYRTSTLGDLRITCHKDNPIPCPTDDGPGGERVAA